MNWRLTQIFFPEEKGTDFQCEILHLCHFTNDLIAKIKHDPLLHKNESFVYSSYHHFANMSTIISH